MLFCNNPSKFLYFVFPITISCIFLLILILINYILSSKKNKLLESKRADSRLFYLTLPLLDQDIIKTTQEERKRKEKSLKYKYLTVFLLTRASTWAKSPFMFTLFSKYHNMKIGDIGTLYVIDAFSSLFFGPLTGKWADKYGRKLFCIFYCLCVALSMTLRSIQYLPLVYLAQIITGFGAGLIFTTYESWINFEATEKLKDKKQKFLEKLFKTQNILDTISSLIVGSFSAYLYSSFGILAPIFLSIFFAIISIAIILLTWSENKPNNENTNNENSKSYSQTTSTESFNENKTQNYFEVLKDREVFSIGKIESFVMASLAIMIFSWTPWLQNSTIEEFNIGYFYICMIIGRISGVALFELFVIILRINHYLCLTVFLILQALTFFFIFYLDNLMIRILLICLLEVFFILFFFLFCD